MVSGKIKMRVITFGSFVKNEMKLFLVLGVMYSECCMFMYVSRVGSVQMVVQISSRYGNSRKGISRKCVKGRVPVASLNQLTT